MEFRENQAIYLQIADYICEQILMKKWKSGEKIPSIRDLAIELQVTPNTVQRSCDFLQQLEIISNRRGVGIFVEEEAVKKIMLYKKEEFIKKDLPVFFKNLQLLKLDLKDIETLYAVYLRSQLKNKT